MRCYYRYKYRISESARWKHMAIFAGTGSWKSEFMKTLIHNHILYGKTAICVLDPNWDFAEQVAKFKENARPERAGKLTYINPSEFKDVFPVINPLDLPNVSTETLDKVTQALYKTMSQSFKEMDIKLSGAMDGMLYNMLHALYRKKGSSLLDLVRFADDNLNADLVKLGADTDNYIIRDYFENKFMDKNLASTKSRLASRVNNFLAAQSLQRLIAWKTTIDLKKEINQRNLIIFNLSKWKLGSKVSKIYGRFVLTTLLNLTLARADIPEKSRVPCHFYIDEFVNLMSWSLLEVFAEGRKYRSYLTVAAQIIGQGMTAEEQKIILWNANVKVIGKAGYSTRDQMMKEMGFREDETKKKGITRRTFERLNVGKFITQVDIFPPYKFNISTLLLGERNSMSRKKRKRILQKIKEIKYAKPFYVKTPPKEHTENHTSNHIENNTPIPKKEREKLWSFDFRKKQPKRNFRGKSNWPWME